MSIFALFWPARAAKRSLLRILSESRNNYPLDMTSRPSRRRRSLRRISEGREKSIFRFFAKIPKIAILRFLGLKIAKDSIRKSQVFDPYGKHFFDQNFQKFGIFPIYQIFGNFGQKSASRNGKKPQNFREFLSPRRRGNCLEISKIQKSRIFKTPHELPIAFGRIGDPFATPFVPIFA